MNFNTGIAVIVLGIVLLVVALFVLRPGKKDVSDEDAPAYKRVVQEPPPRKVAAQPERSAQTEQHRALQNAHRAALKKIGNLERENEQLTREMMRLAKTATQLDTQGDSEKSVAAPDRAIIVELLQVADNIDRAIASTDVDRKGMEDVRHGMLMIQTQLLTLLRRHHVHPMETKGKAFDPCLHDAVDVFATHDLPGGTVVEEVQKGYLLDGDLLRPALVTVAQSPTD